MTAFNWAYVRQRPAKFCCIFAVYILHAGILILGRLSTRPLSHPTNLVTALKSLLLKIFFLKHYQFIYSTPPPAFASARRFDGKGWHAYEVDVNPNRALKQYDAVVLYLHGGGYAIGEPMQYYVTFQRWRRKAAEMGYHLAIVSLRYRKLHRCYDALFRADPIRNSIVCRTTIPSPARCSGCCLRAS